MGDWNYMSQSTACIDTQFAGSTLTCALPTHTSYDKAYTMAASLPKCTANSYDCYNDKYCRFCFSHADEYWALEAAMGVSVPRCDPADQEKYNCPSKTQINSWRKNGLLSKVHYFWGHNNLPLPSNDAPQM